MTDEVGARKGTYTSTPKQARWIWRWSTGQRDQRHDSDKWRRAVVKIEWEIGKSCRQSADWEQKRLQVDEEARHCVKKYCTRASPGTSHDPLTTKDTDRTDKSAGKHGRIQPPVQSDALKLNPGFRNNQIATQGGKHDGFFSAIAAPNSAT
jgi:hypothetical protein